MQLIEKNSGLVTRTGHIINCSGAEVCPWLADQARESNRQAEFSRATGIWCSQGAREELECLMLEHDFAAHALKIAWQANSLAWDRENRRLVVRAPWIEAIFGYVMVALMSIYCIAQCASILLTGDTTLRSGAAVVSAVLIYGGMVWISIRFVILPNAIARRVCRSIRDGRQSA